MTKSLLNKKEFTFNNPLKLTLALGLFLCSLLSTSLHAQVASYSYSESTQTSGLTYPAITGVNILTPVSPATTISNAQAPVASIGFSFNFNGTDYTTCNVSDNGYITFGGTAPSIAYVTPTSATSTYNGAISAYSYDLVSANTLAAYVTPGPAPASDVTYSTLGSSPNREFVVQYRNMIRRNGANKYAGLINMQIRLKEGTNVIEIWYDAFNPTANGVNAVSPIAAAGLQTAGLRGLTFADYNLRRATSQWPNPTIAVTNAPITQTDALPLNFTLYNPVVTQLVWTPPCYAPNTLAATNVVNSVVTWVEPNPKPATYIYEVRTSGAFLSGASGRFLNGTASAGTPTFNASGLTPGVTYTIYVQSSCGGAVVSTTVTPVCSVATIPYSQTFESVTAPAIPTCNSTAVTVGVPFVTVDNTATAHYGFNSKNLITNSANASDTWFFTQKITFPTAGSYRLSYKYGGSRELPQFIQKMKVAYGATNDAAGMTTIIADHNNIKESPLTNIVNFVVAAAGDYYVGFNGYAGAVEGYLQLDDIYLSTTSCYPSLTLTSALVTSNSAILSWSVPSSGAPTGGYQYYISTSNTAPVSTTVPTGTTASAVTLVTATGLTSSTTYYFWVRSDCGGGDLSQWSSSATFTTLFQPTYCTPSSTVGTSYISNFATTGGISNISNATTYSAGGYGNYTSRVVSQSAGSSVNFSLSNNDTVGGAGLALWVDWNNDGTFATTERFYNSAAYIYGGPATGTITVPGGQALGSYRLRVVSDYYATSPDPCTISATGPRGEAEDYTFTVTSPPPALTLSASTASICSGNATTVSITTPLANFNVYAWSPSVGVTLTSPGNYSFNPTTTTTYTLTGTQTSGSYLSNFVNYTVTVNPLPTPIVLTPTAITVCPNAVTPVTATGGIVSGVSVAGVSEDFNSGTGGYTTANTSIINTLPITNAAWTLRPSPFTTASATQTLSSNDASQFYTSDSDYLGSGSTTNTELASPVFSLVGYTDASLSFWQYYRSYVNGSANVELSTNGGTSYTSLASYTTTTIGGPNTFVNTIISLNAYVGMSNLKLRFRYTSQWGYRWCIDNVKVSGSATTSVVWTPIAGLYSNALGTIPYVLNTPASTIYVKAATNGAYTYTATVTSPQGCPTTSNVIVTVLGPNAGTASSNQTICGGSPADLTLTGFSGTVVRWEYATTLAGLSSSPTAIPSSASATLTSAQMGALFADRYYRAVVTNGTCASTSNVIKITFNYSLWDGFTWINGSPDSTKSVIFDGDYTSSGDINACSVSVTSGNVVFLSGHSLVVQNGVDASGGTLTFENNASLVQVNDVANATGVYSGGNLGSIVYRRNTTPVNRLDYTYWSTPVAPQTLVGLSPFTLSDKYYYFNAAINNWAGISANALMNPGQGYIIRAPQTSDYNVRNVVVANATNGQFSGIPNSGTITTPVVGPGNLNLIGNPYPSAINADLFLGLAANQATLNGTIYFWTHNTSVTANNYDANDYAVYNLTGSVGASAVNSGVSNTAPLGKIAAGQSFFVQGIASGTATFKNAMRVVGNNSQFYRNNTAGASASALEKNRLWLEIFNTQGAYKQALVGYIETATNSLDRDFDGEVFDVGNSVMLYSLMGTTKLSIQGKALPFDVNDIIPLGFKSTMATSYEIKLSDFDGLFVGQDVYLEDKLLNVIHDLKQSNYSFVTSVGTFDNRFQLRFTNQTLHTDLNVFTEEAVLAVKNGQNINIKSSNSTIASIEVFDVRGSQLYSKQNINSDSFVISNLASPQQVLLIRITSVEGKTVTKKLIF